MKKCVLAVLAAVLVILALPVLAEEAGYPEQVFDVPKQEYSVTEKDVFFIPVDYKGMPFENIEHRVTSERFFYYYVDPLGVHVFPIAAGTATISLVNRQNQEDKVLLFITVEDSAVDRKGEDNPLRAILIPRKYGYMICPEEKAISNIITTFWTENIIGSFLKYGIQT